MLDELLEVIHSLNNQESKLQAILRECRSSISLEEYNRVCEERDTLVTDLASANERISQLEHQLSACVKEAQNLRETSDFTNQIQTQALAQARDEAHRWHDQCTRMEAAREVRAAQIDALIQALHASTATSIASLNTKGIRTNQAFPNRHTGKQPGSVSKRPKQGHDLPPSSSHPKGMSETATKLEDETDRYIGLENEINPLLHLDDVTDPRRIIPSDRWVRSHGHREDDEGFQLDNAELEDESDTDEMVIVARANVAAAAMTQMPTRNRIQEDSDYMSGSGKKRKAHPVGGSPRKAKR